MLAPARRSPVFKLSTFFFDGGSIAYDSIVVSPCTYIVRTVPSFYLCTVFVVLSFHNSCSEGNFLSCQSLLLLYNTLHQFSQQLLHFIERSRECKQFPYGRDGRKQVGKSNLGRSCSITITLAHTINFYLFLVKECVTDQEFSRGKEVILYYSSSISTRTHTRNIHTSK